jgi:DNA replication and repair protein RecF
LAYLSRLNLTNFRNFPHLELDLPTGVVVFFGGNAQGKTTLLEAVYLLAIARSFRAENEREVVNFQAAAAGEHALVGGAVEKGSDRLSVYVGYQCVSTRSAAPPSTAAGGPVPAREDAAPDLVVPSAPSPLRAGGALGYSVRKQIRVSRVRRTAAEMVGLVGAVLFSADDIGLVYGPPSGRRRYLDILISQSDPIYIRTLQRYQRVVQQRNQLLRSLRDGRAEAVELDFWNDQLVQEGAWLTWRRREATDYLANLCASHHRELGGASQDLLLEYRPSVVPGTDLPGTEGRFREALAASRRREIATATTVSGPHRDDFKLLVNGLDMSTFASRGEARTLALTLRLAEADYLAAVRDDEPLVLLDDVLSEMDAVRRKRVMEKIGVYQQSLITTTDLEIVQGFFGCRATYFLVAEGTVTGFAPVPPGGQDVLDLR